MSTALPDTGNIKAAVIVGGHGYDVPGLKALFDSLDGVDWYLQDIDNWVGSPIADQYDVFVFYHMVAWGIWSLRADMKERIDEANRRRSAPPNRAGSCGTTRCCRFPTAPPSTACATRPTAP